MKFKWDNRFFLFGLTAFIVIVCSMFFNWLLNNWLAFYSVITVVVKALSPVIIGLFIAMFLDKPAQLIEEYVFLPLISKDPFHRPKTKTSRILSIAAVEFLAWFFIIGLFVLVLPQIYASIVGIVSNADMYATRAIGWAQDLLKDYPELEETVVSIINSGIDYLSDWVKTGLLSQIEVLVTSITVGVIGIFRGLLNILVGIVISVYLLANKDLYLAQLKKAAYGFFSVKIANGILDLMRDVHRSFGGFFSGKILDSVIIGIISYIVMTLLHMPYTALISLIIGITNIIPVFGPFIGAVPGSLIILFENPIQCPIFIIFVFVLQQFDGNILGPKILGNSIGLSGFWIMFAILFFGNIFGFMGMLLGVPIFAVIYNLLRHWAGVNLVGKELPHETEEFKSITSVDPDTGKPVYKDRT